MYPKNKVADANLSVCSGDIVYVFLWRVNLRIESFAKTSETKCNS